MVHSHRRCAQLLYQEVNCQPPSYDTIVHLHRCCVQLWCRWWWETLLMLTENNWREERVQKFSCGRRPELAALATGNSGVGECGVCGGAVGTGPACVAKVDPEYKAPTPVNTRHHSPNTSLSQLNEKRSIKSSQHGARAGDMGSGDPSPPSGRRDQHHESGQNETRPRNQGIPGRASSRPRQERIHRTTAYPSRCALEATETRFAMVL